MIGAGKTGVDKIRTETLGDTLLYPLCGEDDANNLQACGKALWTPVEQAAEEMNEAQLAELDATFFDAGTILTAKCLNHYLEHTDKQNRSKRQVCVAVSAGATMAKSEYIAEEDKKKIEFSENGVLKELPYPEYIAYAAKKIKAGQPAPEVIIKNGGAKDPMTAAPVTIPASIEALKASSTAAYAYVLQLFKESTARNANAAPEAVADSIVKNTIVDGLIGIIIDSNSTDVQKGEAKDNLFRLFPAAVDDNGAVTLGEIPASTFEGLKSPLDKREMRRLFIEAFDKNTDPDVKIEDFASPLKKAATGKDKLSDWRVKEVKGAVGIIASIVLEKKDGTADVKDIDDIFAALGYTDTPSNRQIRFAIAQLWKSAMAKNPNIKNADGPERAAAVDSLTSALRGKTAEQIYGFRVKSVNEKGKVELEDISMPLVAAKTRGTWKDYAIAALYTKAWKLFDAAMKDDEAKKAPQKIVDAINAKFLSIMDANPTDPDIAVNQITGLEFSGMADGKPVFAVKVAGGNTGPVSGKLKIEGQHALGGKYVGYVGAAMKYKVTDKFEVNVGTQWGQEEKNPTWPNRNKTDLTQAGEKYDTYNFFTQLNATYEDGWFKAMLGVVADTDIIGASKIGAWLFATTTSDEKLKDGDTKKWSVTGSVGAGKMFGQKLDSEGGDIYDPVANFYEAGVEATYNWDSGTVTGTVNYVNADKVYMQFMAEAKQYMIDTLAASGLAIYQYVDGGDLTVTYLAPKLAWEKAFSIFDMPVTPYISADWTMINGENARTRYCIGGSIDLGGSLVFNLKGCYVQNAAKPEQDVGGISNVDSVVPATGGSGTMFIGSFEKKF